MHTCDFLRDFQQQLLVSADNVKCEAVRLLHELREVKHPPRQHGYYCVRRVSFNIS